MVIINLECKKCNRVFNCETGKITFGNILEFEKEIFCPSCGKLIKKDILLTEYGQTQIGELYFKEPVMNGYGIYEKLISNDNETLKKDDEDEENQEIENDIKIMPKKTRRNESCPCGSGKKYKKCCLEL